ncbi:hypothetical protein ACFL2Q_06830, partial [Thermodesulfobacteriota bacterium]
MRSAKKTVRSKGRTGPKGDSGQHSIIDITEIRKHSTFENLLPIDKDLLENITLECIHRTWRGIRFVYGIV